MRTKRKRNSTSAFTTFRDYINLEKTGWASERVVKGNVTATNSDYDSKCYDHTYDHYDDDGDDRDGGCRVRNEEEYVF